MTELELKFDWLFEYLKRVINIPCYCLYWTQNIIGYLNLIYAISIFDNLYPIALLLLAG